MASPTLGRGVAFGLFAAEPRVADHQSRRTNFAIQHFVREPRRHHLEVQLLRRLSTVHHLPQPLVRVCDALRSASFKAAQRYQMRVVR